MKIIIGGLFIILLVLTGCSPSITPIEKPTPVDTPIPVGEKPPDNVNWISPAKVTISNFHAGAVVDSQPITVHNGNSKQTPFKVEARVADYTAGGYLKAPYDVLQDWVAVADTTPILASKETREIGIVLQMPAQFDVETAMFWQFTPEGDKYLSSLRQAAYEKVKADATATIRKRYAARPQDIMPEMIDELVTPATIDAELMKQPDSKLLIYMGQRVSVSFKRFAKDAQDATRIQNFEKSGYVIKGDLRKDKWEFWVSVRQAPEKMGGAQLETEMCSRVLVSMRT